MMDSQIIEAERQLVGIAIREPSAIDIASDIMPMHFADCACGVLWSVLTRLRDAGEASGDPAVIVREARRQGVYDTIGGNATIAKLVVDAGLSSSVPLHVADIRAEFERRRLLGICRNAADELGATGADAAGVRARLDAELRGGSIGTTDAQSLETILVDAIAALGDMNRPRGVPTGLDTFDATTGGLHPGQFVVIAARPSVGKSALAAGMALHASTVGHQVLFISLEMSGCDIALRLLAGESGVSLRSMRAGTASQERLLRASSSFSGLPFRICSGRNLTVDRLRAVCRLHQARGELDVVFVDYIGLVAPSDNRKPRWETVTETSNKLQSLAQTLGVPVVALCQLNRDAEGERPKLSHLRESGSIEQDADIVLLLHRDREATDATLHVAKIRNGERGEISLVFDGPSTRFSEPPSTSEWCPE